MGSIVEVSIVEVDDVGTFIDLRHVVAFTKADGRFPRFEKAWIGLRMANGEKVLVEDPYACKLIREYVENNMYQRGK